MIKSSWSQLKQIIDAKNLEIQWIQDDNSYTVSAVDGSFILSAVIPLVSPISSDQLDFETNYKNSGNTLLKANVVQVLGKDSLSLYPFGAISSTLIAGTTSNWDIEIPYTTVLRGGILFSQNAVMGDNFDVLIIDKNNIMGLGGTPENPTILGTYVQQWFVMPGIVNSVEDISVSESLLQGLFIRITYTSVGNVNPIVIMNFIGYQSIIPV